MRVLKATHPDQHLYTPVDSAVEMSLLSSSTTLHSGDGSQSVSSGSTLVEEKKKTGRPKEWTEKRLRKLSRLYAYSELPRKDITAALREKNWTPSEPAVAKHSKALFGSDPRWLQLRPKNRDDMDKRIEGLKSCQKPTQKPKVDSRYPSESVEASSLTSDPDPSPFWSETPVDDLLAQAGPYTFTPQYTADIYYPRVDHAISAGLGFNPLDIESTQQVPFAPPSRQPPPRAFRLFPSTNEAAKPPSISRSAWSTHISTSSIKRHLPQYSVRYLKKIVRLRDAYSVAEVTTAATTIEHSTIIGPDDTISASGRSDLTLTPKSKDIVASEDQIFPDTFLVLDRCIKHQGICIPGLKPHDNKLCWCAVLEELQPSKADFWTHYYLGDDFDVNIRDSFQNSVLHLLAARGSSWDTILEVISLGADVNAKNIARQNFLQVADCTIFEELEKQASNGRIGTILDVLETSGFEFYHSDYFGRSFFHMIYKRLQRQSVALHSMEALGIKLPITRDAFGCIVSERKRKQVGAGDVLQLTGLLTPESYLSSPPTPQPSIWPFGTSRSSVKEAPSLSTQSSDSMGTTRNGISIANSKSRPAIPGTNLTDADLWKNARLIETARLASCATWIEETEGRNGLQCLAEAVLDIHIENDKVIKSNTSSMKRKRCQQDISPGSQRLQLRYQLVKDLVARGVDVNNYDNRGSTVLMAFITHLADGEDDKVLAKILTHLIRHGANIHWRNRQGDSALHVAIRLGRKVATRVLLDHGANVHARNAEGKGVLSVGQSHYFAARDEPSLYAAIMVCMALAIDYGAVAAPSIVQEWSTNTVVD